MTTLASASPVIQIKPLGFPWATVDPFLFCAYHDDAYPAANAAMGPAVSLAGRDIGQDFSRKDGWSMYHGENIPGFPPHPHRGFETVTIVRKGLIDHADSLGATARFGQGDVQWLTAGRGIVHSEMFPLLDQAAPNPLELFQIWLNLPARNKMADPHFTMFWSHDIPRQVSTDAAGRSTEVAVIAGRLQSSAEAANAVDQLDRPVGTQLDGGMACHGATPHGHRGALEEVEAAPRVPALCGGQRPARAGRHAERPDGHVGVILRGP